MPPSAGPLVSDDLSEGLAHTLCFRSNSETFREHQLCLRLATRLACVRIILGQTHALALIGQRAPGLGDFQNRLSVILRDRISGQPLAFGGPATVLGKDVHLRFLGEVVRYRFLMCCWDLSWRSLSAASLRQGSAILSICSRCASLGALRASASHSAAFRWYSLTWRTVERLSTATRCWSRGFDLMIGAKGVGRAVQVCDSHDRRVRPLELPGGRRSVRRRPRLRLARYG